MSLAGAIEALRRAVPPVPSAATPAEPPEAAPDGRVPPVPSVPPENEQAHHEAAEPDTRENPAQGQRNQNGEVLNSSVLRNPWNPLSEQELAAFVTRAAHRYKLEPADLWAFLSPEDIEALQTGDPEELRALAAFAYSRSLTGERTRGGHDRPFPGVAEGAGSFKPVCCGDCAHFERDRIGDGHGIGRCKAGMRPGGGALYPGTLRTCRGFAGLESLRVLPDLP
jgi:hypothetical protein